MSDHLERSERKRKTIANNRKARHDFHVVESFEAGIVLQGTEVKSLRDGKVQMLDSYAAFQGARDHEELWLFGLHISPYEHGTHENHEAKRRRKLLLSKRELGKIKRRVEEKGLTLVPLSIYFSGPYAKIELGLVRGKKQADKREVLKKRDEDRKLRQGRYD